MFAAEGPWKRNARTCSAGREADMHSYRTTPMSSSVLKFGKLAGCGTPVKLWTRPCKLHNICANSTTNQCNCK